MGRKPRLLEGGWEEVSGCSLAAKGLEMGFGCVGKLGF